MFMLGGSWNCINVFINFESLRSISIDVLIDGSKCAVMRFMCRSDGAADKDAGIVGFFISLVFAFTFLLPGGRPLGLFGKPGMNKDDDDDDTDVIVTGALIVAVATVVDTFGVVIFVIVAVVVDAVDVIAVETG